METTNKSSKNIGFTVESNENYAVLRDKDNEVIRHATEYEEVLFMLLEASEKSVDELIFDINALENTKNDKIKELEEETGIRAESQGDLMEKILELEEEVKRLKGLLPICFEAGAMNKIQPFTTDLSGEHCPDFETWSKENNISGE